MKRALLAAGMAGVLCLLLSAEAAQPEKKRRPEKPAPDLANVKYGPHERNVLDLWKAKSDRPTPLVVFIHGGGFAAGSKEALPSAMLDGCLKAGISVIGINYRLSPAAKFPAHYMDSARAIQFVRWKAKEWNLDPARVAATGGSAGAGISLWIGFHDDLADPKSDDPVSRQSTRLTCMAVMGAQSTYDPRVIQKIVGGRAHEHPALLGFYGLKKDELDTPDAHKLFEEAAPVAHLTAGDPPVYAFYNEPRGPLPDKAYPGQGIHHINFGTYLKERMDKLGIECVIRHADELADPNKEAVAFFVKHFGRSASVPPAKSEEDKPKPGEKKDATKQANKTPAKRPNILWLIGEDFGQHLSCYGAKGVSTPNLDGLAANGVRFTRFFTTAPVCSPSRSAFMTGMYQTTIDAHHHRSHRGDGYRLPEGVRLLPDWLHDAGYFTANVQKMPAGVGFKGTGKTDWNFNVEGKPFDSADWADLKSHQPFYAQVNFHETHREFNGDRKADPAKVEIPPYYPDHPVVREDWARYLDAAMELDRKIGLVLAQLEKDGLADNTIVIFFGDNGQAHVRGKQFCYDSGLLVPLIIRWPAKLDPPADFKAGAVSDRLLASIDLTATTLSLAGVEKPAKMQGRVFLGPREEGPRDVVFGARDRCDETLFRLRTARDARYRYIRNFTPDRPFLLRNDYKIRQYPVWTLLKQLDAEGKLTHPSQKLLTAPTMPEEELYDTQSDPHETVNLASSADPEHQAAIKRLRSSLEQWIEKTQDSGSDDDYAVDWEWAKGEPKPAAKKAKPPIRRGKEDR